MSPVSLWRREKKKEVLESIDSASTNDIVHAKIPPVVIPLLSLMQALS